VNGGLLSTPRPVPGRLTPALAGTAVVLVALPVVVLGGWSVKGWGIAAGLWVVFQAIGVLLSRMTLGIGNAGSAGVAGIGRTFRAAGLVTVLIVIAATNSSVGLTAAIVYALAFTAEFVSSLLLYISGESLG
jgi:hypothetical protein